MKNFLRAMRFAWPYRYRAAFSVICAVLAAAFWGLNFTAIYPVLKILGSDKNLQQWVDDEIKRTKTEIDGWRTQVDQLTKAQQRLEDDPSAPDRKKHLRNIIGELAKIESKLQPLQRALPL